MRILLLDTNLSSLPIYQHLVSLGHIVFVVGVNETDTLADSSLNYIQLDYSNVELISEFMNNYKMDVAFPGCNDVSYKIASILNEKNGNLFNISPLNISEIINDKNKFKDFALDNKLKVPMLYSKNDIIKMSGKKIIVKPTDAYSGKGVSVLYDFSTSELNDAIQFAELNSISKECIIEEFVSGELYSHSAFIKDGEYFEDFIVQEYCTINPYSVDTSWVIDKNKFPIYNDIREEVRKIFTKLNLCDGLVHTQFIVDGDTFWILEVTRRCPGDLYSKLIQYSTGFNYSKHYVDFILKTIPSFYNNYQRHCVLRRTITFKEEKFWYSIQNTNDKLMFLEFYPLVSSGKKLQVAPKGRAGIVFYSSVSDFEISEL
jgi:predicted ATP-grasp superfamily ATP-dependent carboligase